MLNCKYKCQQTSPPTKEENVYIVIFDSADNDADQYCLLNSYGNYFVVFYITT